MDSLPGTVSLFSEAYAELMGTGETGLEAQSRFYKDIATGTIKSADILPIFARLASERAAPKIGIMKKTSIAEQGRFSNAWADLLKIGSDEGIEHGFRNFFKSMTMGLEAVSPLVKGFAGSFEDFTKLLRPVVGIVDMLTTSFTAFSDVTGIAEKNLINFAILGGLMTKRWGRVGLIFTGVAMVIEDIVYGLSGKDSYTKDLFDWVDNAGVKLETFTKVLIGMGAAFLTMKLGLKALKWTGDLGGLFGSKGGGVVGPPSPRGTSFRSGLIGGAKSLGMWHLATSALGAGWGNLNTSTDELRSKYGLSFGEDTMWGDTSARALAIFADLGNLITFGFAEKLGSWLGGALFDAIEWVKEYSKDAFDSLTQMFRGWIDGIRDALTPDWVKNAGTSQTEKSVLDGVTTLIDSAPKWMQKPPATNQKNFVETLDAINAINRNRGAVGDNPQSSTMTIRLEGGVTENEATNKEVLNAIADLINGAVVHVGAKEVYS